MQRKQVIFVADSLDNAHKFQQVLSSLDVDVAAGSSAQFKKLLGRHPACDLVVYEARGGASEDVAGIEALLLDGKGICASSGSACTSGSLDPSHVLLAIGRPHEVAHGSLRLTLCESNTEAEIDHILACVPEIVAYLRGMSPVWRDLVEGKKSFIL